MTLKFPIIDPTDRADGKILEWDSASGTHVYVDPPTPGGAAFAGQPVAIVPVGSNLSRVATVATADTSRACPVIIPATMLVRALMVDVSVSAAGSVQWGLFDYSADETAATQLVAGSGATGGTNWREIPATSAPVSVDPGAYMLIVKLPASSPPTLHTYATAAAAGFYKFQNSYTWTATPNLASGWSDSSSIINCYLEGDIDASGTRW